MPTFSERLREDRFGSGRQIRGMSTGMGSRYAASPDERRAAMGAGQTGAPMGTNGLPMDVVYDQRPEQFEKNLKLQREDLAVKRQTNDTINAIRQQDANTRAQRAGTYEESVDKRMDEAERIMQQYINGLGIVDAKGKVQKEVAGINNASREGIAGGRNQTALEIARGSQAGQTGRNNADNDAAMARERFRAQNSGMSETQIAQGLKNRANEMLSRNPEYSRFLGLDEKGVPYIKESEDGTVDIASAAVRKGIIDQLYGGSTNAPPAASTSSGVSAAMGSGNRGLGSSALGTNVGGLGAPKNPGGIIGGMPGAVPEGTIRSNRITGKRQKLTNGDWVDIK